ncbi:uncharacterized protein TNCV_1138991 [Trichonephila clavipes]|nr:uncharacterized protein TNCV_1138991 [Trichonephila clavipes]
MIGKLLRRDLRGSESDSRKFICSLNIEREAIRKDRPSSQLRIVYDASSHNANSLSLNSCLHIGPNLYPEIFDILLRFRLNAVAFTADMKQAFLQILLNEEDRVVTKLLFSNNPYDESRPPSVYWFTRVLFDSSSPFLLSAIIKHHLKKYLGKYTNTVNFLKENIYVDDIMGCQLFENQALRITLEAIKNFEDTSIPLHQCKLIRNSRTRTVAYLRVTSSNKEILSFFASKNRIAPLKTLTLPRLELMGALLSARLSSNILKALKLDIPCFFGTDSSATRKIQAIHQKLNSGSRPLHQTGIIALEFKIRLTLHLEQRKCSDC